MPAMTPPAAAVFRVRLGLHLWGGFRLACARPTVSGTVRFRGPVGVAAAIAPL
jgi:hypothetical protein